MNEHGRSRGGVGAVAMIALLILAACGGNDDAADRVAVDSTNAGAAAAPITATGGDADQQFLREMTNHHQGLVMMAHEAMEKTGSAVQQEATDLDQKQDEEIEQMLDILLKAYSDPHIPTVSTEHQAMAAALEQKSGTAYDMAFEMNVVQHHQEGIAMIDRYLPRLIRPEVKAMAEQMKADQQREVQELQSKMGNMGR